MAYGFQGGPIQGKIAPHVPKRAKGIILSRINKLINETKQLGGEGVLEAGGTVLGSPGVQMWLVGHTLNPSSAIGL